MHFDPFTDPWPPAYDAKDLAENIRSLVQSSSANLAKRFYYANTGDPTLPYQGDIISLVAELPFIDDEGGISAHAIDGYWMIVGNTCDIAREITEVQWSQLVPVQNIGQANKLESDVMGKLSNYKYLKQFYLPPWSSCSQDAVYAADFLRPVTIDKRVFDKAKLEARLTYYSWILFHACLVRFLARADGRNI